MQNCNVDFSASVGLIFASHRWRERTQTKNQRSLNLKNANEASRQVIELLLLLKAYILFNEHCLYLRTESNTQIWKLFNNFNNKISHSFRPNGCHPFSHGKPLY